MTTEMKDFIGAALFITYIINMLVFFFSKRKILSLVCLILIYVIPSITLIISFVIGSGSVFALSFIMFGLYIFCANIL